MPITTNTTEVAEATNSIAPQPHLSALSIFHEDKKDQIFRNAPVLPPNLHGSMSPRKQALKRHEQNQQNDSNHCMLAQTKRSMKLRVSSSSSASSDDISGTGPFLFKLNLDGKTTLVAVPLSHIVVYHETHEPPQTRTQTQTQNLVSGTVLARGVLEIFQLHNCDVTYMSCGESFVYPLLPKLNILRTTENSFVLPLANPRRYWKIVVGPVDRSTTIKLESVLQSVVKYTNLVSSAGAQVAEDDEKTIGFSSELNGNNPPLLLAMFSEVPPSPPLVSASPPPDVASIPPFNLAPNLNKNSLPLNGFHAFSSPQNELMYTPDLHAPKPRGQDIYGSNPQWHVSSQKKREKVETSSMDSLLDEYEETLSATRSVSHYDASSQILASPAGVLAFPSLGYRDHFDSPRKPPHDTRSIDHDWSHLSKAAGRQHSRRVDPSHGGRSRKSSTSELYTSVSSWMDPGQQSGTIPHSKSIRSLASRQSLVGPNGLFDVYRQISTANQKTTDRISSKLYTPALSKANGTRKARENVGNHHEESPVKSEALNSRRNDGLTPSEVYDLIRNRDNTVKPKSTGIRGFFGW